MATNTANLNLIQPDENDFYNIGDFNANASAIDDLAGAGRTTETVKANADSMVSHGNSLTPHQFEDKRNNKKYLFGFQVSAEGNPQIIYEEVENE